MSGAAVCQKKRSAERVYAKFSSDPTRKSSNITLTNGDLTATQNTLNHRGVYLDTDKTSGKWAVEFYNPQTFTGSKVSSFGFATSFNLTTKMGLFSQGVSYQPFDGSKNVYVSAPVTTTNFFRTNMTPAYTLVVFDFDNRQIICLNPGGTALISSAIAAIGEPLYVGISMYGSNVTDLNAGQTAFTAGNEALIAAYETANGVTINRGLWA